MNDTVNPEKEWSEPYLFQRIKRATQHIEWGAFGGGLKDGGFAKKAADALSSLWRWDYMGAAEYEWGIVPAAIAAMVAHAKAEQLTSFELPVTCCAKGGFSAVPERTTQESVFGICREDFVTDAKGWLVRQCFDGEESVSPRDRRLRDRSRLWDSLVSEEAYDKNYVGGLDCTNGWLAFTDREVWERACSLFEVSEVPND